jgi:hypothetical protein
MITFFGLDAYIQQAAIFSLPDLKKIISFSAGNFFSEMV